MKEHNIWCFEDHFYHAYMQYFVDCEWWYSQWCHVAIQVYRIVHKILSSYLHNNFLLLNCLQGDFLCSWRWLVVLFNFCIIRFKLTSFLTTKLVEVKKFEHDAYCTWLAFSRHTVVCRVAQEASTPPCEYIDRKNNNAIFTRHFQDINFQKLA